VHQGVYVELNFTHFYTGLPGSTHHARVLKNSSVFQEVDLKFRDEEFLLGDLAYPIQPWLITPYKNYMYGNMYYIYAESKTPLYDL